MERIINVNYLTNDERGTEQQNLVEKPNVVDDGKNHVNYCVSEDFDLDVNVKVMNFKLNIDVFEKIL